MQLELKLDATILPFPAARRRKLVEQVAKTILRENDANALHHWRAVVDDLSFPLLAVGVPRPVVENEVRRFHDAVQAAMWRVDDQPARPGDAG